MAAQQKDEAMAKEIPARLVMQLRAATGLSMMQCKKALVATGGDYEKAVDHLRKEGLKAADTKSGRATGEGLVAVRIAADASAGTLVGVACETEPVARTPMFLAFVDRLTAHVHEKAPAGVDALLAQPWIDDPSVTVDDLRRGLVARIGENVQIVAADHVEVQGRGAVGSYVHHDGKTGALVSLGADPVPPELGELAREVCMHVVFARPEVLTRDQVPEEVRQKEAEIARAQVAQDPKMASKPPQVLDKIAQGKLDAFYRDRVLLEQPWFREPTETVAAHLARSRATVQAFRVVRLGR